MAPEVAREPGQILPYMAPWTQVTELRLFTWDVILDHLDGLHAIQGSLSEEAEGPASESPTPMQAGIGGAKECPSVHTWGTCPLALPGRTGPANTCIPTLSDSFGTSDLQNCKGVSPCCFQPLSVQKLATVVTGS